MKEQKRYRRIAMSTEERDGFLTSSHTCRIATVSADGLPHVVPLWFVWLAEDSSMWFYSVTRSKRWFDITQNPQVSVVVDAGEKYDELRGVELSGPAVPVGEIPRIGDPNAELTAPERAFTEKYGDGAILSLKDNAYDGRHAWLQLMPEKIVSWDFRKIATLESH